MTYTLILLLLISTIIGYAAYVAHERERRFRQQLPEEPEEIDAGTRRILGERAYITMTERVAEIMRRHSGDRCIALSLTSGTERGKGADELHHVLPGDPVILKAEEGNDIQEVGVYSGGYKIGEFLLLDAEAALKVMRESEITGTYICEQNCYDYYDKVSVRIIIFFRENPVVVDTEADATLINTDTPYKVTLDGSPLPITLYQN